MVRPYPVHTLEEALAVARAIQESNAGLPFDRVLLAKAIGTTPASSGFTMKLNSSSRYGLTQGGYNDATISLTPRGEAIVAPRDDEEQQRALLEAALQPELFMRFYQTLDGRNIPEDPYAQNMLQRELGIHPSLSNECLRVVKANGQYLGILTDRRGSQYVSLAGAQRPKGSAVGKDERLSGPGPAVVAAGKPADRDADSSGGRIFIGHLGSPEVVEFVTGFLGAFDISYTVAEVDRSEQRPIAAELSRKMRSCSAAILVLARRVDPSREDDPDDLDRARMLYLRGASSLLYGDRVVALTERGLGLADEAETPHRVQFERGRLEDVGLALVRELHGAGAIEVRAPNSFAEEPHGTPEPGVNVMSS